MNFQLTFSAATPLDHIAREGYNLRNDMFDAVHHHPQVEVDIAVKTDGQQVTLIGTYHLEGN